MKDNQKETRVFESRLEYRAGENGSGGKLSGLAVPFNVRSMLIDEDDTRFVEIIDPGAFEETINSNAEVMMLSSHEWDAPLARRSAGRLSLSVEADGIHFEATPPDTTRANDLTKDISAGNIRGMSFGFVATEDKWTEEGGELVRRVLKGELYEISPVVCPAYPDTAIASRSLKEFQKRERKIKQHNALRAARLRLLKTKLNINKGVIS